MPETTEHTNPALAAALAELQRQVKDTPTLWNPLYLDVDELPVVNIDGRVHLQALVDAVIAVATAPTGQQAIVLAIDTLTAAGFVIHEAPGDMKITIDTHGREGGGTSRLVKHVSSRTSLPAQLVAALFRAGWVYSEHEGGASRWQRMDQLVEPARSTVPITAEQLDAALEAKYRAEHPEFVPSSIEIGEKVRYHGTDPSTRPGAQGVVTDVRENGASVSVAWTDRPSVVQNVASGHLERLSSLLR